MSIREACLDLDTTMALNRMQIDDWLIEPESDALLPEQKAKLTIQLDLENVHV